MDLARFELPPGWTSYDSLVIRLGASAAQLVIDAAARGEVRTVSKGGRDPRHVAALIAPHKLFSTPDVLKALRAAALCN